MLEKLATEKRNPRTMKLDEMSTVEILEVMNEEDHSVPRAIGKALPSIAELVEKTSAAIPAGGRIIYMGAGTSGRLGVLDAVECPPTFGTDGSVVVGLIAGGENAFMKAAEKAEDSLTDGRNDLMALQLTDKDVVIGIAASGRTPYVIGGLEYAKEVGAVTGSIACNADAKVSAFADYPIEIETGSEILTGSTRLKAGTAQKNVLNMISTATMVKIGKVYKNLMVDVKPTNDKLVERAKQIIMEATGVDAEIAKAAFEKADHQVKPAIVMILADVDFQEAVKRLEKSEGFVKTAIA